LFVKRKEGGCPPYLDFFFALALGVLALDLGVDLGLGFGLGSSIIFGFAKPLSVPVANPRLI
jgi:hypothetical protein